ncbi:ABC transporter permease [Glycomyces sp. L485]|uniref:ABC transporter permease n=1 Tax=Glycomyces sp. L485 TaxID=2909235 RepID=UPI001F4B9FEC|nr:ABC transporter permease [Glycomyces sp. L485]MCH7231699.1 ABC transporter permease [Glycomyces sp. L485]
MSVETPVRAEAQAPRSRAFLSLVRAFGLTWLRDRSQVFFNLVLPGMFLVLLVSVYGSNEAPVPTVLAVGDAPILDTAEPGEFEVDEAASLAEALEALADGDADAAIVEDGLSITVHYSQTNATGGAIALDRLEALVDDANVEVLTAAAGEAPLLDLETSAAENNSLQPVQYLAPGILAWGIAISGVFGAAGTIVDWKRDKLMRRLRMTPASAGTFVGARITMSLLVALVQTALFLAIAVAMGLELSAWTWFAVPLVLLGTAAFLAIGVVIGGIAKTGPGAAGLSNMVTMPMAFISGAFFPLAASPEWLQWVSVISPMRYLNESLQAVVVRGASPVTVLPEIGFLAAFAAAIALFAWKTFKYDEL